MWQPHCETMERGALEQLQLTRLRETIQRIAENNPAYWEKIGSPRAEAFRSLDDVTQLPLLTKADLRAGYPFGYACAPQKEFARVQMSSGTTGKPVLNPYTRADILQWAECMARCLTTAGVTREDVIQITPSFGLPNGGFGFHYGAEALGAFYIPAGPGRTLLQLQLMRDLNATVITAIATYPLRLMEAAREENFDFRQTKLRVGIFGSEIWSDELRARIGREMGIETFDIIGMTETGGVGMGIDCAAHQGNHVWQDHYLVEIVNPQNGALLPDGQAGELVVTTLTRHALPLIRFRTGDVTRIISRERCDCGRTHLRLARFTGRCDDMIIFKGVNFYPSQIEQILLRHEGVAHDYHITLAYDTHGNETIELVVEQTNFIGEVERERIAREILDFVGLSVTPNYVAAGTLARPVGKAVRVIDKRK
ncbi:MAG: phenylacetate--CoA ligase family protein [Chloroflexota bacterium]|nr:MAG: phenylacetate--CoA ligase family protein [Chloroflexota bacterium]